MIPASKLSQKKLLLRALEGEVNDKAPFWLMRQAGRYLPEYRALREKAGSFLNLCFTPEYAAEVTLQPLRRFGMDGAILFSDILVVPFALGQELAFVEGEGPKLGTYAENCLNFTGFDKKLAPVYETLKILSKELPADKTLIGFAGAPFTLACYMLEGRGDGKFKKACDMAASDDPVFIRLMKTLTKGVTRHLVNQVKAGADAVQLFDSWAGLLPEDLFKKWVIVPAQEIAAGVAAACPGVPMIGFPRGAGKLYPLYAEGSGMQAVGIDQTTTMEWAAAHIADKICLQGNLDPEALLEGGHRLKKEATAILKAMRGRPFVFNLGHGVIKETPPDHVATLADIIRNFRP